MMVEYKKYKINILYSEVDDCYYPVILDQDGTETYDGRDVEYAETIEDAIDIAKEFIDEMEEELIDEMEDEDDE